jgi:Flp pilus assembly pilin Flp
MNKSNGPSLPALVRACRGANMVEYSILVGLVAVFALLVFQKFGSTLTDGVKKQTSQVSTVVTNNPTGP